MENQPEKQTIDNIPVPLERAEGAVPSMVCGIVGLVLCCLPFVGVVLGIIAIVLYSKANKRIMESSIRLEGKGMAIAGLVCGIIAILSGSFYLIWWIIFGSIFSTAVFSGLF